MVGSASKKLPFKFVSKRSLASKVASLERQLDNRAEVARRLKSMNKMLAKYGGGQPFGRMAGEFYGKSIPEAQACHFEHQYESEFIYDLFLRNWILNGMVNAIVREETKNGWGWRPTFASKCDGCDITFDVEQDECPYCHGITHGPDPQQLSAITPVMLHPNNTYSFKDILKRVASDAEVLDDWYVFVNYSYTFDPSGTLYLKPKEMWVEDSRFMWINQKENGELGSEKEFFCPVCGGNELVPFKENHGVCPYHGIPLFEVAYKRHSCNYNYSKDGLYNSANHTCGSSSCQFVYYAAHEVIHSNRYAVGSRLYGNSKIKCVSTLLALQMAMDAYQFDSYDKGRQPKTIVNIKSADDDSLERFKEMAEEEAAINPNPLLWANSENGVEVIKLMDSLSNIQTVEWQRYARDAVGSVLGVTPIFVGVVEQGKTGNHPRMQIDVQNRATEEGQDQINEGFNQFFNRVLGITDWEFYLKPVEPKDRLMEQQIRLAEANINQLYHNMGFTVSQDSVTGEFVIFGESNPDAGSAYASQDLENASALDEDGNQYDIDRRRAENGRPRMFKDNDSVSKAERPRSIDKSLRQRLFDFIKQASVRIVNYEAENVGQHQARVDEEFDILAAKSKGAIRDGAEEAMIAGMKIAAKQGGEAPDTIISIALSGQDQAAIDAMLSNEDGVFNNFARLSNEDRQEIKKVLLDHYSRPDFNRRALAADLKQRFNVAQSRAESWARTEVTAISNQGKYARYAKQEEETGAQYLYGWRGPPFKDTTPEVCRRLTSDTSTGVPLDEMKNLFNSYGARFGAPHVNCRRRLVRLGRVQNAQG